MTRIDTVDQLNALPIGSVILDQFVVVSERGWTGWFTTGVEAPDPPHLPATLLYVPGRDLVQEAFTQGVHSGLNQAVNLATDPERGVPFDSDHDQAIVAAWIDELRDDLTKEPA